MFVAREQELRQLKELYDTDVFQMLVVYGRRRVGKSTLLRHFCQGKTNVHFFTARETTSQENLALLSMALLSDELETGMEDRNPQLLSYQSFDDAIGAAFAQAREKRSILVIDEYPYLARSYPSISSLLQDYIDAERERSHLMLVLCGSSMSFMEHQVLGHQSPLYGRRTAQLRVKPFDYLDSREMLSCSVPARAIELYSLVGGIPLYLEELDGSQETEWNLANKVLGLGRFLYAEPENFLLQEVRSPALYNAVVEAIARGCTRPVDIENACHLKSSAVNAYLTSLIELGIVEKKQPVGSSKRSQARYRISDNLFRFWHTFVPKYGQAIEAGLHTQVAKRIVEKELSSYMGHCFEEICRQWLLRQIGGGKLEVLPQELGSWWGADPTKKTNVDVDVVLRGLDGELIVGECKWETAPVSSDVIGVTAHRAQLISRKTEDIRLMLFSKSGFTKECVVEASRRGNVTLVTVDEMF